MARIVHWIVEILKGKNPIKQFKKAAKRVQRANAKLVAFEKGFIDEEGIKDREWYRHLGVAPGKWLGKLDHNCLFLLAFAYRHSGYGATTLPSIYDAIVYEKNATFVSSEVKRVNKLLKRLAKEIEP